MPELRSLFLSHSHKDWQLAKALKEALTEILPELHVAYSSDKDAGGGPQGGRNWLEWIRDQMLACQEALLLLTPYSIQKPWPMWEAGAVAGMAAVGRGGQAIEKAVTPLRFNLPAEGLPGPFVVAQAYDGTSLEDLKKVFRDLLKRYDYVKTPNAAIDAIITKPVTDLHEKVRKWSTTATALVTEGTVVEWCERLDRFRAEKRSREIKHLHRWLSLLYEGPPTADADGRTWHRANVPVTRPWDIRLHLRLGENYVIAGELKEAIVQYELASELAPLDVYVLHKLALAQLKDQNASSARDTIDRILSLDKDAPKWNAEVAGLEGRYWKDEGERLERDGKPSNAQEAYRRARDAYRAPLENGRADHYLADNAGQMSLKLNDREGAQKAYENARASLEGLTPDNESIWTLATRVHVALVLGPEKDALDYLKRIGAAPRPPSADEIGSIRRGLAVVRAGLGKTDAEYQQWLGALGT